MCQLYAPRASVTLSVVLICTYLTQSDASGTLRPYSAIPIFVARCQGCSLENLTLPVVATRSTPSYCAYMCDCKELFPLQLEAGTDEKSTVQAYI